MVKITKQLLKGTFLLLPEFDLSKEISYPFFFVDIYNLELI